ncbi:MAG: hypothetical protein ACYSU7_11215 [Planctomycetota bacterium]|jgi:hypothetical protein
MTDRDCGALLNSLGGTHSERSESCVEQLGRLVRAHGHHARIGCLRQPRCACHPPDRREIDIASLTDFKGVFEPRLDPVYFRREWVNREIGSIVWPNGADFCPDALHEKRTPARTQESAETAGMEPPKRNSPGGKPAGAVVYQ